MTSFHYSQASSSQDKSGDKQLKQEPGRIPKDMFRKQNNFPEEAKLSHPSREVTRLQSKVKGEIILANGQTLELSLRLAHTTVTLSVWMVPVQSQRGTVNIYGSLCLLHPLHLNQRHQQRNLRFQLPSPHQPLVLRAQLLMILFLDKLNWVRMETFHSMINQNLQNTVPSLQMQSLTQLPWHNQTLSPPTSVKDGL